MTLVAEAARAASASAQNSEDAQRLTAVLSLPAAPHTPPTVDAASARSVSAHASGLLKQLVGHMRSARLSPWLFPTGVHPAEYGRALLEEHGCEWAHEWIDLSGTAAELAAGLPGAHSMEALVLLLGGHIHAKLDNPAG